MNQFKPRGCEFRRVRFMPCGMALWLQFGRPLDGMNLFRAAGIFVVFFAAREERALRFLEFRRTQWNIALLAAGILGLLDATR